MNASPAALDILADVAHSFSKDQADGAADFYHDANVAEARKLRDLLQAGLLRLNELMAAWPEQMVLVELADRCKALLAVPSTAPLAKLLAFVESLLLKMTDWEAYASRDTSLSDFSGRLTALVVDWRRLELKSWAGLLETQEREFRSPIAEWWFRMYDLCIQGPIAPSDNNLVPTLEAQNEYLETLLGMLRTFIEQTPAGQFRDKLSLVESFGYLAAVLRTQSPIFPRISSALLNLSSFYETQALRIDIFLREEKKKIAKDVNDVIRLASWKDVNVYALKASAQKSHRQLYKRVRALRKVLESPSSKFVDDTEIVNVKGPSTRPSMCQPSALIAYSHDRFTPLSGLSDIVLPKPLVNIETTLSRLMKIVQDDNSVHEAARSEFHLEALAETIITRSQELQAEQPKGSTKDEREKQSKALMDRKRKAWSSLLAEAKRIGLSPRPSTKLVQDLSSMASLLDPGPLSKNVIKALAHFEPVLQSLDNYFHRICSIMPRVRSAASQHHLDVSPSQLQSAAGHLDSAFKTAHASRHDISRELDHVSIVSQAYRKLLVLKDGGVAPHQLNSHQESIHALHSNLFYLRSALKESFSSMTDQAQFMTDADKAVVAKIQVALRECISEIEASKHELDTLLAEHGAIAPMAASHYNTLERARDGWKAVGIRLASLVHTAPQLAYLLKPTLTWMEEEAEASNWGKCAPGSDATDASQSALQIYATTMSAILVSIQALQDTCQSAFEEDGEYAKAGLTLHYKSLIGKARALHTASISQHVRVLSDALAELSKHDSAIFLASQLIDR